jgi:two-component system, OmpR family, sensor histidine kinase BaeS
MTPDADRDRLAILVHEVRSPVAALAAIAETYRDPDLETAARRSLAGLAVAACLGIERVVADATVTSILPERIDVAKLVEAIAATWSVGGANVRAHTERDLPTVEADPLRIKQALDNLVSNALAHSPPGETVKLEARRDAEEVLLSVTDAGPGIPRDEHERIFEAGVRLNTNRPGSGLGLAIARAIAEAHEGGLSVESIPGQGAKFTISLPLPQV